MATKNVQVQVKATGPGDDASLTEGQFTALAAVFDNVDQVGDVVMPGAFTDTLTQWKSSGDTIPLYWCHRVDDPAMNIGSIIEATETGTGLLVKAQLDLENPTAAQVYRLLKGRRVSRMSFMYDIKDAAPAERDGEPVYELRKLALHEVSVVQVPANPEAVVQDVKRTPRFTSMRPSMRIPAKAIAGLDADTAALVAQVDQAVDGCMDACSAADAAVDVLMSRLGIPDSDDIAASEGIGDEPSDADSTGGKSLRTKTGRVISAKNEKALRGALDKISAGAADVKSVLAALDSSDDDSKASPAQPADAGDSAKSPTVEPARSRPVSARLAVDSLASEFGVLFLEAA